MTSMLSDPWFWAIMVPGIAFIIFVLIRWEKSAKDEAEAWKAIAAIVESQHKDRKGE